MNKFNLKKWISGTTLMLWALSVTAATVTTEHTVVGHAPAVTSVTLDKTTPSAGETVQAKAVATDVDGDTPVTLTWQWLRNGHAISGATLSSYTLTQEDVDAMIAVSVTPTTDGSTTDPATGDEFISTPEFSVRPELSAIQLVASKSVVAGSAVAFTPVRGAGGMGILKYSVTPALPPGLSMSTKTGEISGTSVGLWAQTTYTVTVTDSATPAVAKTATFMLSVIDTLLLKHPDVTGIVGQSGLSVAATGGNGNAIAYASSAPSIVEVDAATGDLTLKAVGTADITATVVANGALAEQTVTTTVTVNPVNPVKGNPLTLINPNNLITATVGRSLDIKQYFSGGNGGKLTYSITSGPDDALISSDGLLIALKATMISVVVTEEAHENFAAQTLEINKIRGFVPTNRFTVSCPKISDNTIELRIDGSSPVDMSINVYSYNTMTKKPIRWGLYTTIIQANTDTKLNVPILFKSNENALIILQNSPTGEWLSEWSCSF